jgi:uncharacterized BrkB/YihY/UPF0761 family membrane protein
MGLNPIGNPNFAKEAADTVERLVGVVHDKTTKPVILIVRGLVFGLLVTFTAVIAFILLIIVVQRLLQMLWAVPFDDDTSVWMSYYTIGGIFLLIGALAMSRRHASGPS